MAITGIILHTLGEKTDAVRAMVEQSDDLQFYGLHEEKHLVIVGEMPSRELKRRLEGLEKTDGVLAVYTTFVNTEDEQ
ncbi:MAG: chaperone NapD [Desulfovibrionaceae bacterium]|nr:chaperone NapD [Desulfovibrionaceae bacterium]